MYKGDDDTFIIPENLAFTLKNMRNETNAIGNLRVNDEVIRNPECKYFIPEEIFPKKVFDRDSKKF